MELWVSVVAFLCGLACGVVYGGMFCGQCRERGLADERKLLELANRFK